MQALWRERVRNHHLRAVRPPRLYAKELATELYGETDARIDHSEPETRALLGSITHAPTRCAYSLSGSTSAPSLPAEGPLRGLSSKPGVAPNAARDEAPAAAPEEAPAAAPGATTAPAAPDAELVGAPGAAAPAVAAEPAAAPDAPHRDARTLDTDTDEIAAP